MDLADYLAGLQRRGLSPAPLDDKTSTRVRLSSITGPDGNTITLVEPHS